jgi:hypothetical protein
MPTAGCGVRGSASGAARPCTTSCPPSAARRSCRLAVVSSGRMASSPTSSMSPVSSPASICMMVMPVLASPASMARWMGAAPRQRGSSEPWMFRQPSGGVQHPLRQDQAVGGHHHHVGIGASDARRGRRRRRPGTCRPAAGCAAGPPPCRAPVRTALTGDGLQLHAAAGRPVGLGQHQHNLMPARCRRASAVGRIPACRQR